MVRKKILLLIPTLQAGGQERVAVNTAEILLLDYDVTMIVFNSRDAAYAPMCPVIDLNIPAQPGKLKKVWNVLHRAQMLRKLKRRLDVSVTFSFGRTANLANILSFGPGKTLCSIRSFADIDRSRIFRFICQRSDAIVCCAREIQRTLLEIKPEWKEKTSYLYNPYEVDSLRLQGEEPVFYYCFSENTIVTHGRLEEVKKYPRLIKAFSIVKKEVPDAQLLIIGDGSERERLESLVYAYGLQDSVTMLGFRRNPFAYLAKSRLYVLSSYSEGFPNALVEGMVFLPAVAVDCKTGPREILSDGPSDLVCKGWEEADYGILVQPAAKQEDCAEIIEEDRLLAEAMLAVLSDPVKAIFLREKARARVNAFSCGAYREQMVKILDRQII